MPGIRPYDPPGVSGADLDAMAQLAASWRSRGGSSRSRPSSREWQPSLVPETSSYQQAFSHWLRRSVLGQRVDPAVVAPLTREREEREARDIGIASGATGGFLAPASFATELIKAMKLASSVRDAARVWISDTGRTASLPMTDDTGNLGAIIAENAATTTLDPTFTAAKVMGAYMYQSLPIKASWQLFEDSAFDIETELAQMAGERLGRVQNTHFTNGTGVGQPEGIVTAGVVGLTQATGNTTTMSLAGLTGLVASVDPIYRRHPSAAWLMSDPAFTAIQALGGANPSPMFLSPGADAAHPRLLGYPVLINPDMAPPTASSKSVLFGALALNFVIRDVKDVVVSTLKERFADQLQTAVLATIRSDAKIRDPKAAKILQQSAT